MTYRLVIGNKNTSSWSHRPWIAMRQAGIAFEEININLRAGDAKAQILRHSPAGKVPALVVDKPGTDGLVVWDSLAILEYLAEAHPEAQLWPADATARAVARSVSAEMHSGFPNLREHCTMDLLGRTPMPELPEPVAAEVRRIVSLWRDCRRRFGTGGGFLFGTFTIADAMYAPVCGRVRTYIPDLAVYGDGDGVASAYVAHMLAQPSIRRLETEAKAQLAQRAQAER